MRIALTDVTVTNLKTCGLYMDTKLPAFGVRVGKNRKTWVVLPDKRRIQKTIGHHPDMPLGKARDAARKLLAFRSPYHEITLGEAVEQFLGLHKTSTRASTHYSVQRHLNGYIVPMLGKRPLGDVKTHEVMNIIDDIEHPAEAAKTFHIAKQFWRWAAARGHCPHILTHLGPPSHSPQRTRVLTDDELGRIWTACGQMGENGVTHHESSEPVKASYVTSALLPRLPATYCTIVKLLILTGQRRGEITAFQPSWLRENIITIPKEVAKNSRENRIPIGALSAALITQQMNTLSYANGYIFLDVTKLFCDWSKCKKLLDKISGVTGWTLHDLRRTHASKLASLGVRIEVIERILNHHSGTFRGVAGVYQRYDFMPEMKAAVEKHDAFLMNLFSGQPCTNL